MVLAGRRRRTIAEHRLAGADASTKVRKSTGISRSSRAPQAVKFGVFCDGYDKCCHMATYRTGSSGSVVVHGVRDQVTGVSSGSV